jgi:hypothetical protein
MTEQERPDSVAEHYDDRNEAAEDPNETTPVQSRPENVIEGAEGDLGKSTAADTEVAVEDQSS